MKIGQEMPELFFTKYKGWKLVDCGEKDNGSMQYVWIDSDKKHVSEKMCVLYKDVDGSLIEPELTVMELGHRHVGTCGLPQLHTSLDLQEEWVWPELFRHGYCKIDFFITTGGKVRCHIPRVDAGVIGVIAETKPLAQIEAALKALGVLK